MNLETLKHVDELLEQRTYAKHTIDAIDFGNFNCLSVSVGKRLQSCDAIWKIVRKANTSIMISIYDQLREEVLLIEAQLIKAGIDIKYSDYISGEKKWTHHCMTTDPKEAKMDEHQQHHVQIRPGESHDFGVLDKFIE